MGAKGESSGDGTSKDAAPSATFHARVAGVGLITTVVVLVAACLTFMLQQWAVARTQSHRFHEELATIAAQVAAPSMTSVHSGHLEHDLAAVKTSDDVRSAQLLDAKGRTLAAFDLKDRAPGPTELIVRPVVHEGRTVGEIRMVVTQPALTPMLPQFIALTFVLLFGGVGVALFLARSLAHKVIKPVQSLSAAMHEVAAGGSFTPVKVDASDELFQSLTESFNHLLAKLAEREDDLILAMRDLEVARDEANAANVLKTQFLANMSHEIRTPLNGVLAMAEVMALGQLDQVQRDRLDVIRRSGGLLLAVLNDVLDLSKIEAGKLTLFEEDFDVEVAVDQARENFAVMAKAKGLGFDVQVAEGAKGWWRGDADRLRQIVGNLLSNAVKFTQAGRVHTVAAADKDVVVIRVIDSGPGIADDLQDRIFDKFHQGDAFLTRSHGGTGLGLTLARHLVELMGGEMSLESQLGRGSTFVFTLPVAPP